MKTSKSKRKLLINIASLLVVVGIIVYVMKNSLGDIFRQLAKTEWSVLFLILLLGSCYLVIEGWNHQKIAEHFRPSFTLGDGFFVFCYGAFYRVITFGTGTLVAEIVYLKRKQLSTSQGMGIITSRMMLYKMGMLVMSSIAFVTQFSQLTQHASYMIVLVFYGLIATGCLVFFLFLLSTSQRFHQQLLKQINKRVVSTKWQEKIEELNQQIVSLRMTVKEIMGRKGGSLKLLAINIVKLIPWYSIPYVILSREHTVSFVMIFSYTALTSIIAGVLPSPAGIGSFEFIYLLLFTPLVGKVDAASSLLLYRFATYVLPFLIGMIYAAIKKKERIQEELYEIKENN